MKTSQTTSCWPYRASIIIPTYNRRDLLNHTLQTLVKQTLSQTDFEVIVADDGSSDDTFALVQHYQQTGQLAIRYCWQPDLGYRPGSARNMGILLAQSELCILIDSGVLLAPDAVEQHIRMHTLAERPLALIGYVYGFEQFDTHGDELKRLINPGDMAHTISLLQQSGDFADIREAYYQQYNDDLIDLPAPWIFFWTCHVSARRQDFINAGLFDVGFDGIWGCEDNDMAIGLQEAGTTIVLNRQAIGVHHPHDKGSEEKFRLSHQNRVYLHQKRNTYATYLLQKAVGEECSDLNERILTMPLVAPRTVATTPAKAALYETV